MAKPATKAEGRNVAREYRLFGSTTRAKKKRAKQNAARRIMMRKGLVKKGDGKDVHHVSGKSNHPSNLKVTTKKKNRSMNGSRPGMKMGARKGR
jgi:hypothetical protein